MYMYILRERERERKRTREREKYIDRDRRWEIENAVIFFFMMTSECT